MSPTKTRRSNKATSRRLPRPRVLLDRGRLTVEMINQQAGRADWHDADPKGSCLSGNAPRDFHVVAYVEQGGPWLWIGIDPNPHDTPTGDAARRCFAVISGDELHQFAEDVVRWYPVKKGGAK